MTKTDWIFRSGRMIGITMNRYRWSPGKGITRIIMIHPNKVRFAILFILLRNFIVFLCDSSWPSTSFHNDFLEKFLNKNFARYFPLVSDGHQNFPKITLQNNQGEPIFEFLLKPRGFQNCRAFYDLFSRNILIALPLENFAPRKHL
jgi:hypothetical protein